MNSRLLTDVRCWLTTCLLLTFSVVSAQRNVHIHTSQQNTVWDFPVSVDLTDDISFSESSVVVHLKDGNALSFSTDIVDSLNFTTTPGSEDKNPYRVFQLNINTTDGTAVTSKDEYVPCFISLGARGSFSDYSGSASIRCRGNSSFLWYDKKPYRIKLDTKHKLLGLDKAKSWVLLANYRDVTDMMNTFVFEMGRALGLPYTNHTRYVELFLNGDYKGIYQLTEQIQQNKNRVAVSDDQGILISLDVDDGPGESPYANDNFWSSVYRMPVCVKYPDDERWTVNTVDSVRRVFAQLETAIRNKNYPQVQQLLDVPSFIKYLLIQEFVYNVELSAPRSIYMHKDGDGPWVMGPLWDFDAGYDFDWGQMTTGHTFFTDFSETVMGSNPLKRNGQYNYVPQFFTDLFGCPEFVKAYKAQWAAVKDTIVTHAWNECMRYVEQMRASGAIDREFQRWPISGKRFDTELNKMKQWLQNRNTHFSYLVAAIPTPSEPVNKERFCGSITLNTAMNWYQGYGQDNKVRISKQQVCNLMGLSTSEMNEAELSIVPLYTDGTEGENHTNGVFGGWFDSDGDPGYYAQGHVYIEVFNDLWNWSCGLYKENCWHDSHAVTMQYQYPYHGTLLKVNIEANFTIAQ